jgi:hypothetical protein
MDEELEPRINYDLYKYDKYKFFTHEIESIQEIPGEDGSLPEIHINMKLVPIDPRKDLGFGKSDDWITRNWERRFLGL